MLCTLLESEAASSRRAGGTLISVAVHTAAIALAIAATARATAAPRESPPPATKVVYVARPPNETQRQRQAGAPGRTPIITVPLPERHVPFPTFIPTELPSIGLPRAAIDAFASGRVSLVGPLPGGNGLANPAGGVYTIDIVEKAVLPRPGNPTPAYPASLRAAQIDGSVVARFVVDTAGRVEPASIAFTEATHVLFTDAVRQSLLRSRYLPAVVGDHTVRQLVEQRFVFTLTR
jgi:periplasmic protein TonB